MKRKLLLILFIFTMFFSFSFINSYSALNDNENEVTETKSVKIRILFSPNGGSISKLYKYVYYGEEYGSLPKPKRNGYTFSGWYTSISGGKKITADSTVTYKKNKTLYAHWKKKKYEINYELKDGENNEDNPTYYYITSSKKLYNPTKKGYTFSGWYLDSSYKKRIYKVTKGSYGNKTLYAKWTVNKYNISYNGNGSTSGSVKKQTDLKYSKEYVLRENGFKKTGYTFVSWNTKKDGSGTKYLAGSTVSKLSSKNGKTVNLYATWKKEGEVLAEEQEEKTYNVIYNLNGGVNSSSNKASYSSEDTVTLSDATKRGYTFGGWYKESTFVNKVTSIPSGNTDNITLYAKWNVINYQITYELSGGTNSNNNPNTYNIESNITLSNATKSNNTFDGWYLDSFYNTRITSIPTSNLSNLILYAKWIPTNNSSTSYSISYQLDGGINSNENPGEYTPNDEDIILKDATKSGYVFMGWYTDSVFSNKITTIPSGSVGNKVLYARFIIPTDQTAFTIYYNLNGGINNELNPTSYTRVTNTLTLLDATKDGCDFLGWYSDSNFTNKVTTIPNGSIGNINLYAKWTTRYTITYNLDGGVNSSENPTSYNVTTSTITLSDARKAGYNFDGWYSDSLLTNRVTSIDSGSTGNKVLYAKWVIKSFALSTYSRTENFVFYVLDNKQTIYDYNDILIAFYNYLNFGTRTTVLFRCDPSYTTCINDFLSIIYDSKKLSSIHDYVSPFYEFDTLNASYNSNTGYFSFLEKSVFKYTDAQIEYVDNRVDEIITSLGINNMSSIEEKIRTAHDYIVDNVEYDHTLSASSSTAYAALTTGEAICSGYADLLSVFLDKIGIKNMRVSTFGETAAEAGHVWNAVYINGHWRHIDATWDDNGNPSMKYLFYLKTSEQIQDSSIDIGADGKPHHNFKTMYYNEFIGE